MVRFALAAAVLAAASSASAQVIGPYYMFGPRLMPAHSYGYGYGPGYLGPGAVLPAAGYYGRTSIPAVAGPRPVTWYTPGLGYATNVQTGLPWQGPTPASARSYAGNPYGAGADPALARQDRVRRRMETLYAVNHHQLGRDYPKYLDQSLVANSKWKKQPPAAETPDKDSPPATLPAADKQAEPAPCKPSPPFRILD